MVRWCWVKLPLPGRPAGLDNIGYGPTALAVGAGGFLFSCQSFLTSSLALVDSPI